MSSDIDTLTNLLLRISFGYTTELSICYVYICVQTWAHRCNKLGFDLDLIFILCVQLCLGVGCVCMCVCVCVCVGLIALIFPICLTVAPYQSWALSVFLNFFKNKKWFLCIFIKLIWPGVGFLNRTGAKIGYYLDKKCRKNLFLLLKKLKNTSSAQLCSLLPQWAPSSFSRVFFFFQEKKSFRLKVLPGKLSESLLVND